MNITDAVFLAFFYVLTTPAPEMQQEATEKNLPAVAFLSLSFSR